MYSIAICDDDNAFVEYMERLIILYGISSADVDFFKYYSGEDLLRTVEWGNANYDLLLLNMHNKDLLGAEIASKFQSAYPNTVLVFFYGLMIPETDSFNVVPYRYLLKQYSKEKLLQELTGILEEMKHRKKHPYTTAKTQSHVDLKLLPEDILYIKADKKGCQFFVRRDCPVYNALDNITTEEKLSTIYKSLSDVGFSYIAKRQLVNLQHIRKLTSSKVTLTDNVTLPVARSKQNTLRTALASYFSKKF